MNICICAECCKSEMGIFHNVGKGDSRQISFGTIFADRRNWVTWEIFQFKIWANLAIFSRAASGAYPANMNFEWEKMFLPILTDELTLHSLWMVWLWLVKILTQILIDRCFVANSFQAVHDNHSKNMFSREYKEWSVKKLELDPLADDDDEWQRCCWLLQLHSGHFLSE